MKLLTNRKKRLYLTLTQVGSPVEKHRPPVEKLTDFLLYDAENAWWSMCYIFQFGKFCTLSEVLKQS